jgi:hypothetical protein
MPKPLFIAFTPVPLRARRDGWSPPLQLRFVEALATGMTPGAAAASVGRNRQKAYALRKRPGAESFAAAWDAATAFAARQREARRPVIPPRPRMPTGFRAEAVARAGRAAVFAARSPEEARAAFHTMLDALYGPKDDNTPPSGATFLPPMGGERSELSAPRLSLSGKRG